MKIVFVAVFDDAGRSSNNSQRDTLTRLGHQVHTVNYRVLASEIGASARDAHIVDTVAKLQPDLTIFAKATGIGAGVFETCKRHTKICYWFPDAICNYGDPELDQSATADFVCADKWNVIEKSKEVNRHSYVVADGFDTLIEKPRNLEQDISVSFIGSIYGARFKIIQDINCAVEIITNAYAEKHSEAVSRTKINLNFCTADGASARIYKVLAAKGFLLSDDWPGRQLKDGEDLVLVSDMDDLNKKIEYYLEHDEERNRIRETGYETIQKYSREAWANRIVGLRESIF